MNHQFQNLSLIHDSKRVRLAMTSGRIFEILRQAIIQLELKPGTVLSEAEIARQFGVSRQPVREAFIKLSEINLLEIRPQRGTFVCLISIHEVETARFLREAIEIAIVRKAAECASSSDTLLLKTNIAAHKALSSYDHKEFHRLDEEFHHIIAKCADCEDAWRILVSLKVQMDRVRFLALTSQAFPIDMIVLQHEKIGRALENRNAEAAVNAMYEHLNEIQDSLPKLSLEFPDFFSE